MQGNWICAYLSLLPVVEAVLREWAISEPSLTFNKMKGFIPDFIEYLKNTLKVYEDERVLTTDSHIEYLQYTLNEVLYADFDTYADAEFSVTFNRNLTLHKLEGVVDMKTGLSNITRILLLLDIIAELYLMQNPQRWWDITFYADIETNIDFQLRWNLYKKHSILSVGPSDLLIIANVFLNQVPNDDKTELTNLLKTQIELIGTRSVV